MEAEDAKEGSRGVVVVVGTWPAGAVLGALDRAHRTRISEKNCGEFRRLKKLTTSTSYLDLALKPTEDEGFAAAGVLLFKRGGGKGGEIELLLARECREANDDSSGGDKLNPLGGKRRSKSIDSAQDVALSQLRKETGGCLSKATLRSMSRDGFPLVLWSAQSKYAMYIFEITSEDDFDVDVKAAGVAGAKRLEWWSREQFSSAVFKRVELHTFALDMLETIIKCNVLGALEDLFDVAHGKGDEKEVLKEEEEGVAEAIPLGVTFDVLGALRESATAACLPLPSSPTYRQITDVVTSLSPRDKRKLQLRFHPDRASRLLGRPASEVEVLVATKAMQLINAVFSDPLSATDVTNAVSSLQTAIQDASPPAEKAGNAGKKKTDDSSARDSDADALSSLLERVKLGEKENKKA